MPDGSSHNPSPNRALSAMLRAGDEQRLVEIYDRHGGTSYALALAILRDHADAEDAVAQAFAQVWRQRERFDPERGGLGAWVHTIVRGRALDLHRSRRRRLRAVRAAEQVGDPVRQVVPGPEASAEHAELRVRVGEALTQLSAEQRQAIELAYFGGMTQTEIAAETGTPLGTVKTRMRAGMQKLRHVLAGDDEVAR